MQRALITTQYKQTMSLKHIMFMSFENSVVNKKKNRRSYIDMNITKPVNPQIYF